MIPAILALHFSMIPFAAGMASGQDPASDQSEPATLFKILDLDEVRRSTWRIDCKVAEDTDTQWAFSLRRGLDTDDAILEYPIRGLDELRNALSAVTAGETVFLVLPESTQRARDLAPRIEQICKDQELIPSTWFVGVPRSIIAVHAASRPIALDDPIRNVLAEHKQQIEARYEKGRLILPRFRDWVEVGTEVSRELFPNLRFATITWDELEHPEAQEKVWGRAGGLRLTLVIDSETLDAAASLGGTNVNVEQFGELLAQQEITISSQHDAERIWAAHCDLSTGRYYRHAEPVRISDDIWRIHSSSRDRVVSSVDHFQTIETITNHLEVSIDPETDRVLSARTRSESSNVRRVRTDP